MQQFAMYHALAHANVDFTGHIRPLSSGWAAGLFGRHLPNI